MFCNLNNVRDCQPSWRQLSLLRWGLALLFFSFLPAALHAAVGGKISGSIQDPTGAVIIGAEVKAVNTATGVVSVTFADARGFYAFTDLPVGHYDLQVHAAGFRDYKLSNIIVDVNSAISADVPLQLGQASQEVDVTSGSVQVDLTNTQLGEVISDEKMQTVPLNGRSYIDLLSLQPGVAPVSSGQYSGSGTLSVNGGRESSNAFMINGGLVEEGNQNSAGIVPNLDSIAEFRIITNNFDAEFGEYSGSQVNVITKSGTNKFHGSTFDFLRNTLLDAKNYYDSSRGKYIQNQFGGTFGGHILKDRLFFFVDYQGTRQVIGQNSGEIPVPSNDDRSGNLSDIASQLTGTVQGNYWAGILTNELGYTVTAGEPYYTSSCSSTSDCVLPGAVIPSGAINTISNNLLAYIPKRNYQNTYYVTSAFNNVKQDDMGAVHIDWTHKAHSLSGYYYQDGLTSVVPYNHANLPGFSDAVNNSAKMLNLSDTWTISPTKLNEFRLQYFRYAPVSAPSGGVGVSLASLGFPTDGTGIVAQNPAYEGVPGISLNSYSFGTESYYAPSWVHNTYELIDNFSWVKGSHSLKFGVIANLAQITLHLTAYNNGFYGFTGSETGSDFADMLLGAPAYFMQGVQAPMHARAKYLGVYAEDSWRVNHALTVNFGLREEIPTPWSEKNGMIETIVPGMQSVVFPGAPTGWVFPGDPGIPDTMAPTRKMNLAPRLGLAWSPSAKQGLFSKLLGPQGTTSIRAAFGLFYTSFENVGGQNEAGDAPYGNFWYSPTPPLLATPFYDRQTGYSYGQRFPVSIPKPPSASNPNTTVDWSQFEPISASPGFYYKNRVPYSEQFNLSIQRQLGPHSLVMIAYVGTEGHRLLVNEEANPGNSALCLSLSQVSEVQSGSATCGPGGENGVYTAADGTYVNGTRSPLGPNFGSDDYQITIGNSNYHSLQGTWKYHNGPFEFLAGYTWSKSIDDSSGYNDNLSPYNHRWSRGLSSFNVPQNFVLSYHYELPLKRYLKNERLASGWIVSGITRFSKGLPVTMLESDDMSLQGTTGGGGGNGNDVPQYTAGNLHIGSDPRKCSTNSACSPYFNTTLFAQESLGVVGNSMPRFFSGPGINNFDMALLKDTKLVGATKLEMRFEFFNLFNHAQFQTPSGNINNSTFGYVTAANAPRIGQVAAKFVF